MSSDQGAVIARRSVSLSKTYPIVGVFLASVGLLVSSLPKVIDSASTTIPAAATGSGALNINTGFSLIAVPLQVFATILFATPVLLLFVYDKNNGVLEYFLSLGMNQRDIYRQYLKAALILSAVLVSFDVVIDLVAGLIEASSGLTLEIVGLVVAIAFPAVAFGTMVMMSFSSLQKQRVGSNQPLGTTIGVLIVMPAYLGPLIVPSLALEIDLFLAALAIVLSLALYFSSGKLISREKLLP